MFNSNSGYSLADIAAATAAPIVITAECGMTEEPGGL